MWTALPRGADSLSLYLDVFVSPRLGIDATEPRHTLSEFPDFEHWPITLAHHITFEVELGSDGSRQAAEVIPAALDDEAWNHLFRPSTFVRPWRFKDLSDVAIYSYPVRFVTAYLADLYRTIGRAHPTDPPTPDDLDTLVDTLGPITDVRVAEERGQPPREPDGYPTPQPPTRPREGCLALPCRLLHRLCRLPRRLLRRLVTAGLGIPIFWWKPRPTPPDPTPPRIETPTVLHPSSYRARPPVGPARLPAVDELEQLMDAHKVIAPASRVGDMAAALAARDITFDFARVKRFYERPESKEPDPIRPAVPQLDFHQALGALGDYPALLRTLGMIIRLRVPRPTTEPGMVRVIPLWDGLPRASDVSPTTRTTLGPDSFAAANRPDSPLRGGLLDLRGAGDRLASDEPQFDVVQIDTDGAAIKTVNLAATLERRSQLDLRGELGIDSLSREALASLRSGGLAIVRPDRAFYLHDRLVAAKSLSVPARPPGAGADDPSGLPSDLFAEDLLRGYRVEVSTDGGEWRSLCARVGTYRLVDATGASVRVLPAISDEGYVKGSSGTRKAGERNPLYVHEVLARWTGWSLTAPRPGKTIENRLDGTPPADELYDRPMPPISTAETEFRLVTSFVPQPGTLPRLRYGHSYRFRVLGVDMAGEPVAAPDPTDPDLAASDSVTYRRFEPAGPPAALALRPYLPGESLEHLVLRSDWNPDPDLDPNDWNIPNPDYDQNVWGATEADAAAQRTRHLFPPKTSQLTAELHGRFEMAFPSADGAPGDPDAGYRLALRESGTLADEKVIDIHTVDIGHPQPTIDAGDPQPVTPDDPDGRGGYWINRANTILPTPYLPDPLVAGVALRGLPGLLDPDTFEPRTPTGDPLPPVLPGRAPLLRIPFNQHLWPDLEPLRIMVADPPLGEIPAPNWDEAQRLLTVFLAKATRVGVLYSCYVGPAGLDLHGVWDIVDDGDPQLRVHAESGAHWMISPPRTLTLVHAVQRPLPHRDRERGIEAPAYLPALTAIRTQLGETRAELVGSIRLDVASTGRIDVIARWDEWLVDKTEGVIQRPREAVAYSSIVRADWPDHDNFPQGSAAFHEFGDTRHRRVRYLIRATSRFREYMKPDMSLVRDTDPADVIEANVLSSARPAKPPVLYAVPTFEWQATQPPDDWESRGVKRLGGSLRVYLDLDWFDSGEGELLGIVLQTDTNNPAPDESRTRYGADATWRRARRSHEVVDLEPGHFPNNDRTESGLTLPGLPDDVTVTVVGFQPVYDTRRELLYADIEVDLRRLPWSYWPFVRIAFVRYQPDSLEEIEVVRDDGSTALIDVKLSPVVLGEFVQLAPDRTLTVLWEDNSTTRITAKLGGRAPHMPSPPRVAFRVQTTRVETPDELDWEYASGPHPDVDSTSFFDLVTPVDVGFDGEVLWKQESIELPAERGTTRMRLEVAEYEILRSDSEFGEGALTRMTYAAHVELD